MLPVCIFEETKCYDVEFLGFISYILKLYDIKVSVFLSSLSYQLHKIICFC